ncbi:hypothetical protein Tco_0619771 [Tanacetum coccineum]
MADLEFVDQHNMIACLEKTRRNLEFHEIVDFLTSSSIHHALTISPTIYISYIEQFWNTASSQTVNDEKQIHATIDSKARVVTKASIRSSLLLNDAVGTACLTNEAIFQNLALMGYEGELNKLTFQKALFSPQWKYLIHTILHCLSLKSTRWNEFSTNIASAIICLATNQKFNFSKLIYDGMLRNLDNPKKKFLMFPRFLMVFLNNQIELCEPFNDVYITPAHTLKVFSNMSRKGVKFLEKVTPLFDSMLVPHQAPKGEGLKKTTKPQPTPSPTQPSTGDQPLVTDSSSSHDTTQDSKDSLEGTNRSEGDQVQPSHDSNLLGVLTSDKAKGGMTLEDLSVLFTNLSNRVLALEASKDAQAAEIIKLKTRINKLKKKSHPGRKNAKLGPTLDDSTFDNLDADHGMDYIDTEEPVNEGRLSKETEELNVTHDTEVLEKGGSNEELVSVAGNTVVSTVIPEVSTATPMTPPTTTSAFEDEDIFLADALVMLSDKTKLKRVAIKEVKESDRPERSILTLKPLPSIDPKDKGKGVLKESLVKKVKRSDLDAAQIAKDAEVARLVYEEELAKLEKEKEERQRQEQASMDYIANLYDEVQAKIDASEELAARLQMICDKKVWSENPNSKQAKMQVDILDVDTLSLGVILCFLFGLLTTTAAAGLIGSLSGLCLIALKRSLSSILIAAGFVQTLFDEQKMFSYGNSYGLRLRGYRGHDYGSVMMKADIEFSVWPINDRSSRRINEDFVKRLRSTYTFPCSTDIAKISRKQSKPDKHGYGNEKEYTRARRMLSKVKIKGQIKIGDVAAYFKYQAMMWQKKTSPDSPIGQFSQDWTRRIWKKHTNKGDFTLKYSQKKHNESDTQNATLAIRVLTHLIQWLIIGIQ